MRGLMDEIRETELCCDEAGLWWLGQAGYIVRGGGRTIAIDPYLSDSAAASDPSFARAYPPPIAPEDLRVDVFIVTHDHLDHLDPETIGSYAHKAETIFIAPRLARRRLLELAVPPERALVLDVGTSLEFEGLAISGIYAVPTQPDVLDTAGYLLSFSNGRSLYHSSDTSFSELLIAAAPRAEAALLCINGKFGNLDVEEAARLAEVVGPRYAIPNHYDLMALNAENPATFGHCLKKRDLSCSLRVLRVGEPFIWNGEEERAER